MVKVGGKPTSTATATFAFSLSLSLLLSAFFVCHVVAFESFKVCPGALLLSFALAKTNARKVERKRGKEKQWPVFQVVQVALH